MKSRIVLLAGAALCSWFLTASPAFAQSSAFTYQGRLNDNGQPANGSYDMTFALFTSSSGGDQVGGTITNSATPVSSGLFTVALDFGLSAFPGPDRWLQLAVRTNGAGALTNGAGAFTDLVARQPISPVPYALHSSSSDTASTASMAAAVVSGVYTTGAYADPSWIRSLSGSKIAGDIAGNAHGFSGNLSGDVVGSQGATVIASDAVTTAKIANGAVTTAKLAAGAVGNNQIAAGAITEGKISATGILVTNLNSDLLDGLHASSFAQTGAGPESKNVGVCNTSGTAAVWDSATVTWLQVSLGGSSSGLLGSGGNIAFANNNGKAAVWSMTAKTWTQVDLGGGFAGLAGSKGNFVVMNNSGKAAAWSSTTKTWTQVVLGSGYGGLAGSGGNFVMANSGGTAAAWSDTTRTWATVVLGSAFGDIAASGGNFVVVNNSGTAAAWNHTTGTWTTVALGGATGYVTGSDQW